MSVYSSLWRGQRGNQAVGLVFIVPLVLMIIGVVWIAGRYASADGGVQAAANAAARDASLARTKAGARSAANAAADRVLNQYGNTCVDKRISVDVSGFSAGLGQPASTRVSVSCTIANNAAIAPGFPGHKTFVQTASSPIDQFRER